MKAAVNPILNGGRYLILIFAVVFVVSINMSWSHQYISLYAVSVSDYYDFASRKPFLYRMLLPLVYSSLFGLRHLIPTGLKHPISSSYEIFQLVTDSIAIFTLYVAMFMLFNQFNNKHAKNINALITFIFWLLILMFGYFIVPSRAYFYPYDFTELALLALIMLTVTRSAGSLPYLLPILFFIASLNKETAGFAILFYGIHCFGRRTMGELLTTLLASLAACILARYFIFSFLTSIGINDLAIGNQFEIRLAGNIRQFTSNPLAWFSILGIMSYTYIVPILIRRHLDIRDHLLLLAILIWITIMFVVGEIRELRVFAPMSLFIYFIFSKHFDALAKGFSSGGKS